MNRSSLIPLAVLALLAAVSSRGTCLSAPNLVLIMADDLGWCDTSNSLTTMGHPSDYLETPAIDRLAAAGMAFTNAYTNGPNCCPTRSAILSGQWPQRPTNNIYLVGNLNRGGRDALLKCPSQGLPNGRTALPSKTVTYAEHLKQSAGYATAHFGKFHVTTDGAAITSDHGFEVNRGGSPAGAPAAYHASNGKFVGGIGPQLDSFASVYTQEYIDKCIKPYAKDLADSEMDALVGTPKHVSDAIADAVIVFIHQHDEGPFLIQMHPFAVHTPIGRTQARKDLLKKYRDKPAGADDTTASFAALVEGMDQSVARVLQCLKTTPDPNQSGKFLADNTVLLFLSDNGGRLPQSNNGPLKGQKGELAEGGIRVPMIAWSGNPELVDAGTVNATPVQGIDIYPTFTALAGVKPPVNFALDGADLSAILHDGHARLDRDDIYWHLPGYLVDNGRDQRPQSIIRSGGWKLIYNYENQSFELYDLDTDIGERINLANTNPEVVRRLGKKLVDWLAATDAPLPLLRQGKIEFNAKGPSYFGGRVVDNAGRLVVVAGEEVPVVLP